MSTISKSTISIVAVSAVLLSVAYYGITKYLNERNNKLRLAKITADRNERRENELKEKLANELKEKESNELKEKMLKDLQEKENAYRQGLEKNIALKSAELASSRNLFDYFILIF